MIDEAYKASLGFPNKDTVASIAPSQPSAIDKFLKNENEFIQKAVKQLGMEPKAQEEPTVLPPVQPQELPKGVEQVAPLPVVEVPEAVTPTEALIPPAPALRKEDIIRQVLKAEGGVSNHSRDPGGLTKYGIASAYHPDVDLNTLTPEGAMKIYEQKYWSQNSIQQIFEKNPRLGAHVFDMTINHGAAGTAKILNRTLGLGNSDKVTEETLARINESDDLVKAFSAERLKSYASFRGADVFGKGWANRVANLNKFLELPSGLGGSYAAAKKGDVFGVISAQRLMRNATSKFASPVEQEVARLDQLEQEADKTYQALLGAVPAEVSDKPAASMASIFSSAVQEKFLLNTTTGLKIFEGQAVLKAFEKNEKALREQFGVSLYTDEQMAVKAATGVEPNLGWFEETLAKIKEKYPQAKLPYGTLQQLQDEITTSAKEIEAKRAQLNTGTWRTPSDAAQKVGNLVFGEMGGFLAGAMADPLSAAAVVTPLGSLSTGAQVAKGAVSAFLAEGAAQVPTQINRSNLGLDAGFARGLGEAGMAGAGVAALGAAGIGLRNLWKFGSGKSAEAIKDIRTKLDEALKGTPNPDEATLHLKEQVEDLKIMEKEYRDNPYGSDLRAKEVFDRNLSKAFEDLEAGRPIREFNDPIYRDIPIAKDTVDLLKSAANEPIYARETQKAINDWEVFKEKYSGIKNALNEDALPFSYVPVIRESTEDLLRFDLQKDAVAFMKTAEGKALVEGRAWGILRDPEDPSKFFIAKEVDIEPTGAHSSRFDDVDALETAMKRTNIEGLPDNVRGFDPGELNAYNKFPNHSSAKPFTGAARESTPTYRATTEEAAVRGKMEELDAYAKISAQGLTKAYTEAVQKLNRIDPNLKIDIGELADGEARSISSIVKELDEDKKALDELLSCMIGSPEGKA